MSGHRFASHARAGLLREEGASLAEMAISCSLLFAMMFGFIQFSFVFYAYHFAADAAREGARYAMVRQANCVNNKLSYCSPIDHSSLGADNGDIQHFVDLLGFPFASNLTTNTSWCTGSALNGWTCSTAQTKQNTAAGSLVKVTASYGLNGITISIPFWKSTRIPISSTSAQVIQQ
jgi:Flp pilus assembly protein TadG